MSAAGTASGLADSFRRSPGVIVATTLCLLLAIAGLAAPWLAPNDPTNLRTVSLLNSHLPPAWIDGGRCELSSDTVRRLVGSVGASQGAARPAIASTRHKIAATITPGERRKLSASPVAPPPVLPAALMSPTSW